MVWIVPSGDARGLDFAAVSHPAIVSGLVYLALRVYSGRSAQAILAPPADYIADIGLAKHLSPTPRNDLPAMLVFIPATAHRPACTPASPLRSTTHRPPPSPPADTAPPSPPPLTL